MRRYKRTTKNGRQIDEHRKVMEEYLGRKLAFNEHVHHINGDTRDNRIENLVVLSPQEHMIIHKQKYPLEKACVVCGQMFIPNKTKRKRALTCSQECKRVLQEREWKREEVPVIQKTKEGTTIKRWDSLSQVQRETGWFCSNIVKCCKKRIPTYKGFVWEYEDESRKIS